MDADWVYIAHRVPWQVIMMMKFQVLRKAGSLLVERPLVSEEFGLMGLLYLCNVFQNIFIRRYVIVGR
jgi:hypothetical protein